MDFPISHFIDRLVREVAGRWGIDPVRLKNRLDSQVNRVPESSQAEIQEALKRVAELHRNEELRPVLRALVQWLRVRASHKVGDRLDDALGDALHDVLRYWKPSWAGPAGQQHLHAYALMTLKQRAARSARTDCTRAERDESMDPPAPQPTPEAETIDAVDEQARRIALSKLQDMSWCARVLTPAEADAVACYLRGDPTAGLGKKKKALFRGTARLRGDAEDLKEDRRRHRRRPAEYSVLVQRAGLSATFRVLDESTGGLALEGTPDGTALEPGSDYLIRTNSDRSVLVRGARCVRVQRTERGLRFGLQFHFQHPLSPSVRRRRRARLSL